jgi:hypothetical protein
MTPLNRQWPNALIERELLAVGRIGIHRHRLIDLFPASPHPRHNNCLIVKPVMPALKPSYISQNGFGDVVIRPSRWSNSMMAPSIVLCHPKKCV